MTGLLTLLLAVALGYVTAVYVSHPKKKKIKWLKIRIGPLELTPNHRLHVGKKTYWLHHWVLYLIILLIPILAGVFVNENFQYPMLFNGWLLGIIIQGLTYSDRFKFRYPRLDRQIEEWQKEFKVFTDSVTSGKIFEQQPQKEEKKN